MRTTPFTESPQSRIVKRSLNFAGWTCSQCGLLNSTYIDPVISETRGEYAASGVKTVISGTLRTTCVKCGTTKP